MVTVDIIIVNYNSSDYLLHCLENIYDAIEDISFKVYIQDNSAEDNLSSLTNRFTKIHLTKNRDNIGFSNAVNRAMKQGSAPYVVILNPDSYVGKDFFKSILQYMETHKNAGIVGPKILNSNGSVQGSARAFPTFLTSFFGRTSLLSRWFPESRIARRSILTKKNGGIAPVEVDWVSGACMVVRRKAIEDVGVMDQRFFMYWEDVDWCRRMWENGWKIVYFPTTAITHYVGGSSNQRPIRSRIDFHKSCYKYFVKYPLWSKPVTKIVFSLGLTLRFLFLFLFELETFFPNTKRRVKPCILFFITEDWYFWSHRLPIAKAARDSGFEVIIATRVHEHGKRIIEEGFKLIPIKLSRKSKNIFKELWNILEIIKIYRRERPDIVHHVTMKPVLYGSMAARIAGIPAVVNALAGLGSIFSVKGGSKSIAKSIVVLAYRAAFFSNSTIGIFQNPEDLEFFINSGIVKKKQAVLIRGSGANLSKFVYSPEETDVLTILFASRMIWDKGAGDFVKAARMIKNNGMNCRFVLVGVPDPENPTSIPDKMLHDWHASGIVEWWGHRDDMSKVLKNSNIVVLPTTYGEGIPKILIEAASCGRAIVATDVPGCKEIVRKNVNGLLVPPNDIDALVKALNLLIKDTALRKDMGKKGREIVINEFSINIVVNQTMEVYSQILRSHGTWERRNPHNNYFAS